MSNSDIDFVLPWVDGSDINWLAEKNKYSVKKSQDSRNIRYRDWELLKYWFRGVEQYAPWINKIHFITWGHLPAWLNTNHPKLNIVNHKDYIPNEYLPTFSSHVIELNMHRINGLSEKFVYFNDDVYIINSLTPQDFFINNLPCDCLVESAITPRIGEFSSILCTTTGVINKHFTKKEIMLLGKKYFNLTYRELLIRTLSTMPYKFIMGFYNPHICMPFLKKTFSEVWEQEEEILNQTCSHKFRDLNDVSQYLFRYWRLCKGEFQPQYPIGKCLSVNSKTYQIKKILKSKNKILAINDSELNTDFETAKEKLNEIFSTKFPQKSKYEC